MKNRKSMLEDAICDLRTAVPGIFHSLFRKKDCDCRKCHAEKVQATLEMLVSDQQVNQDQIEEAIGYARYESTVDQGWDRIRCCASSDWFFLKTLVLEKERVNG